MSSHSNNTTTEATVPGVAKHLQLNECHIAKLADEDLAAIFKLLPPFERLIVAAVCSRWRNLSQAPWRDVTHLDLSRVPTVNMHAVVKKCPNLISVSAHRQNLGDLCRFVSRLSNVTSFKCVECLFTIDACTTLPAEIVACLQQAPWGELIWHNSRTILQHAGSAVMDEFILPVSISSTLRRVQLSGLNVKYGTFFGVQSSSLNLPLLESLIMATRNTSDTDEHAWRSCYASAAFARLVSSENLRELYLEHFHFIRMNQLLFMLANLKTLFLNNVAFEPLQLERLLTQHRSLRVLVLTASRPSDFDGEVVVPVRKLFPDGFNAPPVPQLHLCLGKIAAERLRFHQSPTDALKIYPINTPLPEFLKKQEMKAVFEDSWIASRIKEGAEDLADYSFEGSAESILNVS